MPETTGWILDFHTTSLSNTEWLDRAGGKGANLARLAQAGFAVPRGFILQTSAYSAFLVVNDLDEKIQAALPAPGETDPLILENASRSIRDLFQVGCMPGGMAEELFAAYQALGEPPVAVRSSATAEDTLELSFAGQQDTYLNMVGADALQRAVIDCWSSLWTARAIGYRDNHGIPQHGLSLAVVVQCMVPSHSSGVLFTANPLTGLRSETVIDAAYGLGEALVSGKVEPDQYIVDAVARRIEQVTLGAKAVVLRGTAAGGTEWEQTGPDNSQALTDVQILSLTDLGKQIETLYRMPQDIEWALADDQFHILQSRPITSLYPIPAGLSADPLKVLVSFAAVQGLLAPITPLGRDTFLWLFAVGRGLFGLPTDIQSQGVLMEAGERLWINITPLVRNTLGRKVVATALEYIEPTVRQALMEILDDPRLQPERQGISWKGRLQLAHFALPLIGNILLNLIAPARRRAAIINGSEALLDEMRQEFTQIPHTGRERLNAVSQMLPRFLIRRLPSTFLRFVSGVAAGMASLTALNKLAGSLPDRDSDNEILDKRNLVLEITRGMQHNPTTEMDLELWQAASAVLSQPGLMDSFKRHTPAEMGYLWRKDGLPTEVVALVDGFLRHYGSRGLAEIDIGRGRWGEDPTPVFAALSGYLQITDPHQAPDAVFERGEESARAALKQLTGRLRAAPKGWLKARLARFFAGRMRELLCMRESPKFFAVRMIGLLREELLRCGRDLTQSGELDQAGDVFFLTYQELGEFSGSADTARWRERIASRRRAYELEMHRRQIPRMLLSDGRAFYAGIQTPAGAEDRISGSPVSPGSVEGVVRVVLDPHHAGLQPGEIMVCPGTDPSWTPLFLTAGGLIMEVGGMMTHGAVVAREYGIPAVVGVDQATVRLPTGTRIRLDGSSGQVVLLKEKTEVAVE